MAHTDRIGHGTQVQRSSDGTSSGTFATIGAVRDVVPPALSRDAIESTDNESEDRWHTYIGGMKDGGEFSVEMTFDPGSTETAAFIADLNTDTAGYYRIVFPDTTTWGFGALLTGFEPQAPMADKMVATVTWKISGKPGFVA